MRSALFTLALFHLAFGMFTSQFALFLHATYLRDGQPFGPREVGFAFTAAGAINVFVQLVLIKKLAHLISDAGLAGLGFVLLAAGFVLVGVGTGPIVLAPAVVSIAFGSAFVRPALVSGLSLAVPPARQGTVMGLNQSLGSSIDIVAPIGAGFLIGQRRFASWTVSIVAIALCGALVVLYLARRESARRVAEHAR